MKATIRDLFTDTNGRRWAAEWRFDPASPLTVELQLTARGQLRGTTWVIDRSLLPWSEDHPRGDVSLLPAGPRLVVILYPLTRRTATLVGSLRAVQEFTVAAEQVMSLCAGCDEADCECCAAVGRALDTELAWITREAA